MITQPPLGQLPEEGADYTAYPIDGKMLVSNIGTSGEVEFGFLADIPELQSHRIWLVIVTDIRDIPRPEDYSVTVRFTPAAYYSHSSPPPTGQLHPDARFYVPLSDDHIEIR
jgi:hypothetical protein